MKILKGVLMRYLFRRKLYDRKPFYRKRINVKLLKQLHDMGLSSRSIAEIHGNITHTTVITRLKRKGIYK